MRFFIASILLTTALIISLSSPALAQKNPHINMDDYVPSVHALDPLSIVTTRIQPGWTPTGGLWMTYRKNALTIAGETAEAQVVKNQLVGEFYGALSLKGWASVGLDVPVFFVSNGDNPAGIADSLSQAQGASLGDIRLSAKVKFWDNGNKGFGMGLLQDVTYQ